MVFGYEIRKSKSIFTQTFYVQDLCEEETVVFLSYNLLNPVTVSYNLYLSYRIQLKKKNMNNNEGKYVKKLFQVYFGRRNVEPINNGATAGPKPCYRKTSSATTGRLYSFSLDFLFFIRIKKLLGNVQ